MTYSQLLFGRPMIIHFFCFTPLNLVEPSMNFDNLKLAFLFSLAAILNVIVNWCEVWNQVISGATHISYTNNPG